MYILLVKHLAGVSIMLEWLIGPIASNAFLHRKFLEYFCAWEFVWQFEKEGSISIDDLKTEVFGKHWQDETWHEVLRLIAGMIDAKFVGEILDYLMVQDGEEEKFLNLFLAAKYLAEVKNRSVIAPVANKLFGKVKDLTKYDPRSILKDRATADKSDYVRRAGIQALASNFKDDPDTRSFLKDLTTTDNQWYVRRAAIEALASNFKDDPDTHSILKDRATADNQWYVRRAAIEALASNFPDDPDTRSILKERATADNQWNMRSAAIQALAKHFRYQPELFEIYYNCAVNDPFEREQNYETNPRRVALEIIIKQFPQHPDTLPLLRDKAENDLDEEVRKFAQQKLAELEK
ncbi:MAG: HEAT repeat domain-containing protein [Nostoc sp.]|uniref:HEAT repeat domain-containing protein n=1 Tax=Nostoc sp. TaxID=1180 RepID=UPI002FF81CD0